MVGNIFLKYKYQDATGNWCHAQDTLTFRNRMRDGVNEWQDENPLHYWLTSTSSSVEPAPLLRGTVYIETRDFNPGKNQLCRI